MFTQLMKKAFLSSTMMPAKKAFKDIKEYLTKPPVLVALILAKSFLLFIKAMDHFLSILLAQKNEEGFEQAIYYMSRTLIGVECRYNAVEKEYLDLVLPYKRHCIT